MLRLGRIVQEHWGEFECVRSHVGLVCLGASFKVFVKDSDRYLETGLGSCFLNQFFDNVIVRKDNALNSVMDMGKKPMLDGVPFRGVGRVMADQNVFSDGFGELEHLLFES